MTCLNRCIGVYHCVLLWWHKNGTNKPVPATSYNGRTNQPAFNPAAALRNLMSTWRTVCAAVTTTIGIMIALGIVLVLAISGTLQRWAQALSD